MKIQTYLFIVCLTILVSCAGNSEDNKDTQKKSPYRDIETTMGDTKIKIKYSAPSVKNRKVWNGLVLYGAVWRTGADEATTFEINNAINIEDQRLEAGKYAFFTIPDADEWIIIFNKEHDQWGAFNYNKEHDALRVSVKPINVSNNTEQMSISILETTDSKGEIKLAWEKTQVPIGFEILPKKG